MTRSRRRALTRSAALLAAMVALTSAAPSHAPHAPHASHTAPARLPDRLADSTFWRIVSTFSEPNGTFASENFVSNETEWQYVIPGALHRMTPASAYLGVGPEQNFTYIAAFHPQIAFICDIRRQNMIQHLMYKALIEMAPDRAGFLSLLWARRRPDGLTATSDPATTVAAYRAAKPDSMLFTFTLGSIFDRLVKQHKFALTSSDSATLRAVYTVFFLAGPDISYSSSSRGVRNDQPAFINGPTAGPGGIIQWTPRTTGMIALSNGGILTTYRLMSDSAGRVTVMRDSAGIAVPDTTFRMPPPLVTGRMAFPAIGPGAYATFGSLMTEDDGAGVNRGWLGSDAAFQWLKDFETRNLLIPIVGNFAGPQALRSVGQYLREHDAHVSAFYTSNVEQYLFQSGIAGDYYENVASMPSDSNSIFIRSFPNQFRPLILPRNPNSRLAQTTSSIAAIIDAYRNGMLNSYSDLARLQNP